jgi:hypothetical protein
MATDQAWLIFYFSQSTIRRRIPRNAPNSTQVAEAEPGGGCRKRHMCRFSLLPFFPALPLGFGCLSEEALKGGGSRNFEKLKNHQNLIESVHLPLKCAILSTFQRGRFSILSNVILCIKALYEIPVDKIRTVGVFFVFFLQHLIHPPN